MNARNWVVLTLAIGALGLLGCKDLLKKKDPDTAPSAVPVAVPSAVAVPIPTAPPIATAPAEPVVDEVAVPTSQDFEDEAFEKVTPANFRAEFARLKTEISKP